MQFCLIANRITQKRPNGFSWNLVGGWGTAQGRTLIIAADLDKEAGPDIFNEGVSGAQTSVKPEQNAALVLFGFFLNE